jgi:pimeloyl-ACP methyl ester carboxylesterase
MSELTVSDQAQELSELFDLVVERITAPVEGMHRAIADRSLRWTGSTGEPARRMLDATIASVYDAIRLGGSVVGATLSLVAGARDEAISNTPLGRKVQAAVNATWGDELERRGNALRIEMGVRSSSGALVELTPASVTASFPTMTARIVVLVHGLGKTEQCWLEKDHHGGLWDRLAADSSVTPVMVRYNTGRHISDNGAELAELLQRLWDCWPTPIESVSLVGHSMGGLVIRSACQVGKAADHDWVNALEHLVTVATPHLGAPLEKAANIVSWSLRATPESSPLAEFLDARSVGIKDLRFGIIAEAELPEAESVKLIRGMPTDPPPLPGVDHHFVAAVVTNDPAHPVGAVFGDLMVRAASGTGRGRRRQVEATDTKVLGGRRHFDLLHDSEIQDQVIAWLGLG